MNYLHYELSKLSNPSLSVSQIEIDRDLEERRRKFATHWRETNDFAADLHAIPPLSPSPCTRTIYPKVRFWARSDGPDGHTDGIAAIYTI